MGKNLYIAEKPSVAREFANALKENTRKYDGYVESENSVITWCVGHLVTMSYPEVYDEKLKRWSFDTIPFLPQEFKYEVIASSAKQFEVVSGLLKRPDVEKIYVCTDSGREGEYIYRLVEQMSGVKGRKEDEFGSIPRRKRKSCVGSVRRRIFRNMIISVMPHIFAQRKII